MTATQSNPSFRRRNAIGTSVVVPCHLTIPSKPHHQSGSFPTVAAASSASTTSSSSSRDFDLISIKHLPYTSLKDLIPPAAAVQSPTPATPDGSEISIRNRLVKQAAWAYLQPMSTSPVSSADNFFRRIGRKISGWFLNSPFASLLCSSGRVVAQAFESLFRPFRFCFL